MGLRIRDGRMLPAPPLAPGQPSRQAGPPAYPGHPAAWLPALSERRHHDEFVRDEGLRRVPGDVRGDRIGVRRSAPPRSRYVAGIGRPISTPSPSRTGWFGCPCEAVCLQK